MKTHFLSCLIVVLVTTPLFAQFKYRNDLSGQPRTLKPYVTKLYTPSGVDILRDAPADHLHHHGLMFAIKVDGINFWEEFPTKEHGRQQPISSTQATAVAQSRTDISDKKESCVKMESTLEWKDADAQTLVCENRTVDAVADDSKPAATVLDWRTELTLPPGKEKAVLGGNNYHGLGMRFVESMDKEGTFIPSADAGRRENRLTPCRWMAYTAKVDGKPVTVAIVDMKENPRPMLAFTMGGDGKDFAYLSATTNLYKEPITLTPEKPIVFHYRIFLWDGTKNADEIEAATSPK